MKISKLVIYGKNGAQRVVKFNENTSLIIGPKKTGKSALGEIIKYVLGSDKCNVPFSVISEKSSWYALVLKFDGKYIFIGRKNPIDGADSSSDYYYKVTANDQIVPFSELKKVMSLDDAKQLLTKELGVTENINIPEKHHTRRPLSANIKHSLFYCFQKQNEVAAQDFLFHGTNEHWKLVALKDTSPYFLGVYDNKYITNLEKEKQLKRRLKLLEKDENIYKNFISNKSDAIKRLCEDYLYIQNELSIPENLSDTEKLQLIISHNPKKIIFNLEDTQYQNLKNEYDEVGVKLSRLSLIMSEYSVLHSSLVNTDAEMNHQMRRLQSVGLLDMFESENSLNPFTGELLSMDNHLEERIVNDLQELKSKIENVEQSRQDIDEKMSKVQESKVSLLKQQREIHEKMTEIENQNALLTNHNKVFEESLRLQAKASVLLNAMVSSELESNSEKIDEVYKQLTAIQKTLDKDVIREKILESISKVSDYITEYSTLFDFEYKGNNVVLDYSTMLCKVMIGNKLISQKKIGSASNWVSLHLSSMFGVHKLFRELNSPIPKFLFIDQPSQAYFPNSFVEEGMDEEYENVKDMFQSIIDISNQLGLQVILVDHADIKEKEVSENVVESWNTTDKKLIPNEWK